MKDQYPIFLDITDRRCAVIGGGKVALRKARALDMAGAKLLIVAPEICEEILDEFGAFHEIRLKQYDPTDIEECFLVVAATDNTILNSLIAADCRAEGILVNAVDQPNDCDYFVPSIIKRGGIQIAISTGGSSPAMAAWLKRNIERGLSYRLEEGLEIVAEARRELIDADPDAFDARAKGFEEFFESGIWEKFLDGSRELTVEEVVEWISSSMD
jgi:precorrin-2 dehydrogenase/sirohydrochlorin ferrochelatase